MNRLCSAVSTASHRVASLLSKPLKRLLEVLREYTGLKTGVDQTTARAAASLDRAGDTIYFDPLRNCSLGAVFGDQGFAL
jgi:hypothetical protein